MTQSGSSSKTYTLTRDAERIEGFTEVDGSLSVDRVYITLSLRLEPFKVPLYIHLYIQPHIISPLW